MSAQSAPPSDAQEQHQRQHPRAGVGARGSMTAMQLPTMAPIDELAFGADVPDIGEVAERKADRDQHQRRRLDDKFLQRPARSVSGSTK